MTSTLRRWPSALLVTFFVAAISVSWWSLAKPHTTVSGWPGVDESVIERFAATSEAVTPGFSIDWVQGDLLLFAFLWAGLLSGAVIGYFARGLFADRRREQGGIGAGPATRVEPP